MPQLRDPLELAHVEYLLLHNSLGHVHAVNIRHNQCFQSLHFELVGSRLLDEANKFLQLLFFGLMCFD